MFARLFRSNPVKEAGRRLYEGVTVQARQPAFYADLGAPDTVEGRFELYNLHVVLLLRRLRRQGAQAAETSQALFDAYVGSLDHALREMGVGDLSVGKKMRKLGEAIYGRVRSFDAAVGDAAAAGALEALVTRTVYAGEASAHAATLAAYVRRAAAALAAQPLAELLEGHPAWPAVAA
ncbi:MAG: ubiquinol-cytochrome C chaperone family protein [Caulobacteraceae bacterium]|nr:ubiquinol-cytochrome C chaperone family protein [Caulobacteraceae bacterium]